MSVCPVTPPMPALNSPCEQVKWFPSLSLSSGQLSLQLLLEFLTLCEDSGFIQFRLPFEELKEKV